MSKPDKRIRDLLYLSLAEATDTIGKLAPPPDRREQRGIDAANRRRHPRGKDNGYQHLN